MSDTIRITLPDGVSRSGQKAAGSIDARISVRLENAAPLPRIGQRVKLLEQELGTTAWARTVALQGGPTGIVCEFLSEDAVDAGRLDPAAGLAALEKELFAKPRPRSRLVPVLALTLVALGIVLWQRPDLRASLMGQASAQSLVALEDVVVEPDQLGEGWSALPGGSSGDSDPASAIRNYSHADGARIEVQLFLFEAQDGLDADWQGVVAQHPGHEAVPGLGQASLSPPAGFQGNPSVHLRRALARVALSGSGAQLADVRRLAELYDAELQ